MVEEEVVRERCAGPRHRCYTDEYGNYIDQYSEDCDHTCLPYSAQNMSNSLNQNVGNVGCNLYFEPGPYQTESGADCNYGGYSSSSDLCSPIYTDMKFFDFPQQYPEDYQYDPSYTGYSEAEVKYNANQYDLNQYAYRTDCLPSPSINDYNAVSAKAVLLERNGNADWNDCL